MKNNSQDWESCYLYHPKGFKRKGGKMKCPKCKKKMKIVSEDSFGYHEEMLICINKKCWFFGIKRVLKIGDKK